MAKLKQLEEYKYYNKRIKVNKSNELRIKRKRVPKAL